jgi:hypothetical protein
MLSNLAAFGFPQGMVPPPPGAAGFNLPPGGFPPQPQFLPPGGGLLGNPLPFAGAEKKPFIPPPTQQSFNQSGGFQPIPQSQGVSFLL